MQEYKELYNYELYKGAHESKKETRDPSRGPGRIEPQTIYR